MNKFNTQAKRPQNADPEFSCELLLSYLAKEIAKEYVKRLESNQALEAENHLEEKE